eukprot:TRINITY_DN459_c0_g2_i3.p2 TRINITY_DN459_c0_g2~~TRINITY_DN459_c0_g2_i3.p2  ORF type:complete len:289 (-),score=44.94 TRINITY_DN459_c0_g2_i3:333-1100(-)
MFNFIAAIILALASQNVFGQKAVHYVPPTKKVPHTHTIFRYDYTPVSLKVVKEDKPSPKPVHIVITKKDDHKDAPKPAPKPRGKPAAKPGRKPAPKPVSMPASGKGTECTTVADAVVGTPELSTLLAALEAAGLTEVFADPTLVATVLAPTNDAFDVLFTAFNATAETVLGDPQLVNILLYHVIPEAALLSTDLEDDAQVTTQLGQDLTVSLSGDEVTFVGAQSSATVVTPDFLACEAVVHVIDTVLLPDFTAIA